jgi:hypothetical protein
MFNLLSPTRRPRWVILAASLAVLVVALDCGAAASAPVKDLREKQPLVAVQVPAAVVRAADKPVPALSRPEPAWRSGIIESGQAPLPASLYRIDNQWQGIIGDQHVNVYAGELVQEPGQGVLVIQATPVKPGQPSSAPQVLRGPAAAGALRIQSIRTDGLDVIAASGAHLTFRTASRELRSE